MKVILFSFLLVALLAGCAMAKLSKSAQFKLGHKPSTVKAPMAGQIHVKQVASVEQAPVEKEIADSGDLDTCLATLTQNTREEAVWEEKRDDCLVRLAPFVEEDRWYEEWRNLNRTNALSCLLDLTECNDANEALVEQDGGKRIVRSVYDESIVNHPYFSKEATLRKYIPAMDAKRFSDMSAQHAKRRQRRAAIKCTLDQCEKLVSETNFEVQALQRNVSWCDAEIIHRKQSIMAYLRFGLLYQEETAACLPIRAKCSSGLRLVSFTFQNGDYDSAVYTYDFLPGWAGFANSSLNTFYESGQDSLPLESLRNGDASALSGLLEGSGGVGSGLLASSESWSQNFELNPSTNEFMFFAFPVAQVLAPGDFGTILVSQSGLRIFDNGNFVSAQVIDKRRKRGPYTKAIEDCGCIGDSLPSYDAHEYYYVPTDLAVWNSEAGWFADAATTGVAAVIVAELRWTVPYPAGIPPQVRNVNRTKRR